MTRAYLTQRECQAMIEAQKWLCALCGERMWLGRIEFDHSTPVALGNAAKPDQAVHVACHLEKTRVDVKRIAKAKRLHRSFVLGITKQKRPIPSRGFDRKWKRRINKPTILREAA